MKVRRHPVLLTLLTLVCAAAGCSSGSHHTFKPRALKCRLQTSARNGGRAVVSYDDQTGTAKMSAAISSEVRTWNASAAPVMLVASRTNPAITFRAVSAAATTTTPPCNGSTPRVVTINLSTPQWNTPPGQPHAVKDPVGAVARLIAHALGLASGGKCPDITANKACPNRNTTPGPKQITILQRLYGTASPGPSPS